MKEYRNYRPLIVIGGTAGDFLGEYMAGGILIVLGLDLPQNQHRAKYVGAGMHGGVMYIHGGIRHMGKEAEIRELDSSDRQILDPILKEFSTYFPVDFELLSGRDYYKIRSRSTRPYGNLYAY